MKDGYLRATAGDGGGQAYAAQLIILPLDEIFYRCREEIVAVTALTNLSPTAVLYQALKFARGMDYGAILAQARHLLLDSTADERAFFVTDQHRLIDAMSGIHGAIHSTFHAIYRRPYRFVEPIRLIGHSGLVVRMVP